ncbi:bifunctional 2-polyprenyl-6-hydroxyphenol methylase/3-demethylubiquinol 3-O-methyltransferase UbiG [Amphibiibacter pelophylacis]|uniref:Bifunctional 2-polyprenyl-6-hydroxyphenol methylase/3-demethylubiquinol 3-O-methyltransferase UbiG n=1 Tax=Amphibiibacter pelophylacis TaxID=1799477 RepID=A0ACC6P3F4_9BURK
MTVAAANVNPQEIGKFAALAQHWWDPDGEFKTLHDINPLRTRWITAQAQVEGRDVLDVGCGGGLLTESLGRNARSALGVDLADASLQVARLHALEQGLEHIRYETIAAEALAEREPQRYDVVSCMEMLEHVPDPVSIVAACARLVKPGGQVFFSTLNRHPAAFLGAIVAAEYLTGLIPRGTHDYAQFIQPAELAAWARHAGLQLERVAGLGYNPITRRAWISARTPINYMMSCRRPLQG